MSQNQADSSDLKTKISTLEAETKDLRKKMKGYAGKIGVLERKVGVKSVAPSPDKPSESEDKPPEADKPHFVHSYEKYCSDCGGPNPDFKDETECKNCHQHLGAAAQVEKLVACPFCGSTSGAKKLG